MKRNSLHVLLLTPGFPNDENDTSCLPYLQNYIHGLRTYYPDIQLTVLSLQYPFSTSAYRWNDINVVPLGGNNKKHVHRLKLWRQAIHTIRNIHQENPIHVLHSLWLKDCVLLGNYISGKLGLNHICTAMGTDVLKSKNAYLRLLHFKQTQVVVVSDFHKIEFSKSTPNITPTCIPWGIVVSENELVKPYTDREIDILGVASFITLKDYPTFINTIKVLVRDLPKLVVRIIGDGELMPDIIKEIKHKNLEQNIELLGSIPNHEVQEYMQNSKVLLHTSTFESQGYVFLEALKNGMKIVSRNVGIAQQSHHWYLGHDDLSFANGVKQALSVFEPQAINMFPIKNTVDQYVALYGGSGNH